jgi:hypothetical protein
MRGTAQLSALLTLAALAPLGCDGKKAGLPAPPLRSCPAGTVCAKPTYAFSYGDGEHMVAPEAVAEDGSGRACFTGSFMGTLDLGAAGKVTSRSDKALDGFLFCSGPDGKPLFARTFGDGVNKQFPYHVAFEPGGDLFWTGLAHGDVDLGDGPRKTNAQDVFLARLDRDGKPRWVKTFGDDASSQMGLIVAPLPGGGVALGGQAAGTLDFGGGPRSSAGEMDAFVAAFGGSGDPVFSAMGGGPLRDQVNQLATDGKGRIAIAGEHLGALALGGAPEGTEPLRSGGQASQGYVVVLDSTGKQLFTRALPAGTAGDAPSSAEGVGFDAAGNLVVTGVFEGTLPVDGEVLSAGSRKQATFWMALDPSGKKIAARALTTRMARTGVLPDGGAWMATIDEDTSGPRDLGAGPVPPGMGLVRLGPRGEHLESSWFGRGNPNGLFVSPGAVLFAGDLRGPVDFGTGPLVPKAKAQMGFAARLSY